MKPRGLGYQPDSTKTDGEKPDWAFQRGALKFAAPPSAHLQELVLDVLDQGSLGSCVFNAALQAIRMGHVRQGVKDPKLGSRLYSYYLARAAVHLTMLDAGSQLRTCFEMLNKFGFPPEYLWPYDDADTDSKSDPFRIMPPTVAFHAGFDVRSPTVYRRITTTGSALLDEIKHAIANGHPVCFGCEVDEDFTRGLFNPLNSLQPPTENIAGGHAMLFVGYSGDSFEVLNSWGTDFGQSGYCRFSPDYVLQCRDCWTVEHSPVQGE